MPLWEFSAEERRFLVRWLLANVFGWGAALALGAGVLFGALLMRALLPAWVLLPSVPLAGALIGGGVGYAQWRVLFPQGAPRRWIWASLAGGALGAVPSGILGSALRFDPLVAQLLAGALLAAGVAFGQAFFTTLPHTRWQAASRWALVNAAAGMGCAWLSPSGAGLWLPLTCLLGTLFFGALTGWVITRVNRQHSSPLA